MAVNEYDRYAILRNDNGTIESMPFVKLPINSTDKYEYWNEGFSRLDKISQKYYLNPFFDWLILLANPDYTNEWDIDDGYLLRIPFPKEKAIADYEATIKQFVNSLK
jgi:hypothetical protein